ncbi:MAG: 4Fe-4S dicluster domain-containing protein [Phycisphaerales bacterium]|nr:4Fe-4S dicluster domain-containing protein [Phycisphaerales bacterium]
MNAGRRDFLKVITCLGAGGSVLNLNARRANAAHGPVVSDDAMGVLVDITKCNGCRQCEAACREAAGFETPTKDELLDESAYASSRSLSPRSYTTINRYPGSGAQGEAEFRYVKSNCLHCVQPACVSACLVGALRKQPNGAVTYDAQKCMGCRYCMVACPFEIPTYEYENVFTPQVRKCTLCSNEGNPHKDGPPACVQACPRQCLIWGKRSDLLSEARSRIERFPDRYIDHIYGEHEAGGTSWLFLSDKPFEQLGFLQVSENAPPQLSETIQHGVFKHFVPPVMWVAALGIASWLTRPQADRAPGMQPAFPTCDAVGNDDVKDNGKLKQGSSQ